MHSYQEARTFSPQSIKTFVLGAQKNCLIETVLLSTHNICFGREIRKNIFLYTLLSRSPYTQSSIFSYPSIISSVLGAQKNRLMETHSR